jgi:hypothetical protein
VGVVVFRVWDGVGAAVPCIVHVHKLLCRLVCGIVVHVGWVGGGLWKGWLAGYLLVAERIVGLGLEIGVYYIYIYIYLCMYVVFIERR